MPRGLVATARSGGHCPLRVSGGILCSERGQSRDAFQAIPLEETSPRCNKSLYHIPGTVFALRTLFYCCLEQAAMLPVSQTRAEINKRGLRQTSGCDLSPRLKAVSVLKF